MEALGTLYGIYNTDESFKVWLQRDINVGKG